MLTLSQSKIFTYGLIAILLSLALVRVFPVNTARALTTEAELSQKLSQQFSSLNDNSNQRVLGQTTSVPLFPRGFSYPIPELGNCDSKNSCYEFCQASENLELCSMVSFRNGFMTSAQLQKTLTFNSYLKAGYFANCNSLSTCATLCDIDTSHSECSVLALNLENGSRVLGATDENSSFPGDSILNHCTSIASCSSYSGVDAKSILDSLIASKQAPRNCVSAEQCEEYCNQAQSSECTTMFQKIASLTGSLSGLPSRGRVLNVSDNFVPQDGGSGNGSGGALLDNSNGAGTDGGNGDTTAPPPYQPTSFLGCVSNSQMNTNPTGDFSTPQQTDSFTNTLNQCDQQFSPTTAQVNNFNNVGQQKVGGSVSKISDCVLSKNTSADISSCFAY